MNGLISAQNDPIASLYAVEFSPWIRRIAFALLALFGFALVVVAFAPWQQNVPGAGRVAAYTPLDRPQSVQSPVPGRVVEVFVDEADLVKKGDPLVRIVDIDPEMISRIEAKLEATRKDLDYTRLNVNTFNAQITILEQARDLGVDAFRARTDMAREKLKAAEQNLRGAAATLDFAVTQEKRLAKLAPQWIEEIKLLEARAERQRAEAEVARVRAELNAARAALANAEAELGRERETGNAKVTEARAKMQDEAGKAAEIRVQIADLEGELRAQNTQLVSAPRDGRVFRLSCNTESSIVRGGEALLQIVPVTSQPAVELWVRGVDAPLIEPGRKVRLQFEGWPAVQFIGWPSVAVGTFGGVVSLVDPTDSGNGRFRMLVVPDADDTPWPDDRWLRQGVRAKGWVLLDRVRLWYEIWRQLNAFPPVVALTEPTGEEAIK